MFKCNIVICVLLLTQVSLAKEETCDSKDSCSSPTVNKYTKEAQSWEIQLENQILTALAHFIPCNNTNCGCYKNNIQIDLAPFQKGISEDMIEEASPRGTKYQIIDGELFRDKDCHFPARCAGIEHYLKKVKKKLDDTEFIINTKDWPQVVDNRINNMPVFSFSKTRDYLDILYPAWSFWEGGPAISLYPTGIGKWEEHREKIREVAQDKYPWEKKEDKAFFRGSRTSEERDALILLSRSKPELVDAQYTKNQAWKSEKDTLNAPPASEVPFEDHCKYKYLFNYRGVAASFRFKHLFLCRSLVFHVGDQWLEFFYPSLQPWVHYVPVSPRSSQQDIERLINFFKNHDEIANEIAERGFRHIWNNLRDKDVRCYWRNLLKSYTTLLKYRVEEDYGLMRIK